MDLEKFYLDKKKLSLVVIDVQEALVKAMKPDISDKVIRNIGILINTAKTFQIPILHTEQYPQGLKSTIEFIRKVLGQLSPIEKITFSAAREGRFIDAISDRRSSQIVVTGIESHVCVLQTVLDLLAKGYIVHVPEDAVCSRNKKNWRNSLFFMDKAGAVITSTETIVFQLLERAGTDAFKAIAPLVR